VYSLGLGHPGALHLDVRQEREIWLTAAQSLFAVAVLADRKLDLREALFLFVLFAAQFLFLHIHLQAAITYSALAFFFLVRHRREMSGLFRVGRLKPPR
jgi:cation:H+ antiporter